MHSASTALLFAALVSPSLAQTTPCLGPFQALPLPGGSAPNERLLTVRVSGERALAVSVRPLPLGSTGPSDTHLHSFERVGGAWLPVATTAEPGLDGGFLSIDGDRAVVARRVASTHDVLVLERQPSTGTWSTTFSIPGGIAGVARQGLVVDGERIAVGLVGAEVVEVWERDAGGTYSRRTTLERPVGTGMSGDFGERLDLRGDLLSASYRRDAVDLFERRGNGQWRHALTIPAPPGTDFEWVGTVGNLTAERVIHRVRQLTGSASGRGFAAWRLFDDSIGLRAIFDGTVYENPSSGLYWGFEGDTVAGGTMLQLLQDPICGPSSGQDRPLIVYRTGEEDRPSSFGYVCDLAGPVGPGDAETIDYDGRTLACAVDAGPGATPPMVYFADWLAAELDRDFDCVEDARQIALAPALDRNTNGRLDSTEERGFPACAPMQPNVTGQFASLVISGTETPDSNDLVALASNLPPGSAAVLGSAPNGASLPLFQFSGLQLCFGSATVGRSAVVVTDALGRAAVPISTLAMPTPAGPIMLGVGETWVWQMAYRNGSGVGATPAVQLTLR